MLGYSRKHHRERVITSKLTSFIPKVYVYINIFSEEYNLIYQFTQLKSFFKVQGQVRISLQQQKCIYFRLCIIILHFNQIQLSIDIY